MKQIVFTASNFEFEELRDEKIPGIFYMLLAKTCNEYEWNGRALLAPDYTEAVKIVSKKFRAILEQSFQQERHIDYTCNFRDVLKYYNPCSISFQLNSNNFDGPIKIYGFFDLPEPLGERMNLIDDGIRY